MTDVVRVEFNGQPINVTVDLGNGEGVATDLALRNDLADDTGAGLVGYQNSIGGAVARTLNEKADDILTAADFGADMTGAANSAAAVQDAADSGEAFVGGPGTLKTDSAITGDMRVILFGTEVTGTAQLDDDYPNFGPGALKVIARGTYFNGIIGIVHNTAAASTTTFPAGGTFLGRNDNAGNHAFGLYAESRQYASTGAVCSEIDSFNHTAAPSTNLPPNLAIGTAQNHAIALQLNAGGAFNSSIALSLGQEGSSPRKFLTGIYVHPDCVTTYGLFVDASASSVYTSAVLRHAAGGSIALQLQGVGTPNPDGTPFASYDGASVLKFAVKEDGRLLFTTSIMQSTVGAAGAAAALPSNPTGYLKIIVGGFVKVLPFYEP